MEAKSESKVSGASFDEIEEFSDGQQSSGESAGRGLVMRMCEYAFKVLNEDMDDFFDEHVDAFEQDEDDLSTGRGETLQQYDIFKKYEAALELKFDSFATKEGFSSSYECFGAVKDAVAADILSHKQMMEQLSQRLRNAQKQWQSAHQNSAVDDDDDASEKKETDGAKESKAVFKLTEKASSDENKDEELENETETDDTSPKMIPIMLFFQPVSLESLLETTLSIADYRAFSYIMRMKVKQKRMMREMEIKINKQAQKASERRKQLNALRNLDEIFEDLIDRLCGLTPHRPDMIEYTKNTFSLARWQNILKSNLDDEMAKEEFKALCVPILMRMSQLGSMDEIQAMRKHTNDLVAAIDLIDGTNEEIGSRFLATAHEFIDKTETKIFEALQAHMNRSAKKEDAPRSAKAVDDDRPKRSSKK